MQIHKIALAKVETMSVGREVLIHQTNIAYGIVMDHDLICSYHEWASNFNRPAKKDKLKSNR
ncbi:MAG: hypothetical protein WCA08_18870 [Desulfoferrobacter sp.]